MKIRIINLTPKFLIELLQGKTPSLASNLPSDAELLDIKLDLFSNKVLAVVRSDSFEDIAECYPIPELNLKSTAESKTAPKPATNSKMETELEAKIVEMKHRQGVLLEASLLLEEEALMLSMRVVYQRRLDGSQEKH